ncbi:MAG: radical SAM protein, partial [Nitrosospira sp.]|nr:radical SAM protein [Nitrosospira sp.]
MTLIVPPSQDVFIQIPKVILRVSEIFFSLQGETSRVGLPTVFVRLTGCPLRCNYCDTKYAFYGGEGMSISTVLAEIDGYKARYVTITGGEPLAQKECLILLRILCETGYLVSLETSGALDVSQV